VILNSSKRIKRKSMIWVAKVVVQVCSMIVDGKGMKYQASIEV
jgi:hypothetical protein